MQAQLQTQFDDNPDGRCDALCDGMPGMCLRCCRDKLLTAQLARFVHKRRTHAGRARQALLAVTTHVCTRAHRATTRNGKVCMTMPRLSRTAKIVNVLLRDLDVC